MIRRSPWETGRAYFARWQKDGTLSDDSVAGKRKLIRPLEGRSTEPTACIVDAQRVKTSAWWLAHGGR
ncbi:hypothetical protein [Streptomyces sp. NPDC048392]|uniref:hypothetical protein n=1 Tax=Streptomyces sp. NPDC048392 TaxID=3365543 RepID=UPI0037179AA5